MPNIKVTVEAKLPKQIVVIAVSVANSFGDESILSRHCKVRSHEELREEINAFVSSIEADGYAVRRMVTHVVPMAEYANLKAGN